MNVSGVGPHLFTFSETKVRETRGRKDTGQTAASAACSAHFQIQLKDAYSQNQFVKITNCTERHNLFVKLN